MININHANKTAIIFHHNNNSEAGDVIITKSNVDVFCLSWFSAFFLSFIVQSLNLNNVFFSRLLFVTIAIVERKIMLDQNTE